MRQIRLTKTTRTSNISDTDQKHNNQQQQQQQQQQKAEVVDGLYH